MAAVYDIEIEQGATFQMNLVWRAANGTPIDITGYTARMQVKRRYADTTPLLTFTTENGAIVLGGSNGTVQVTGLATVTDDVPAKQCVYDLELVSPTGFVKRLVQGVATVSPEVTK